MVLLDASVWLAAVDRTDPEHSAAAAVIADNDVQALDFTLYEVGNVAVRSWRRPDRLAGLLRMIVSGSAAAPLAVDAALVDRSGAIADQHSISVYDAAYAAAAERLNAMLVSCDVRDLVSNGLAVLPSTLVSG